MSGTPPPTLRRLGERVDVRLGALLATERERWSSFDSDLARPIDEIARLVLAGGKRLRPAFCHWGYVGAGGGDDDQIDIDAGSALELMHAFALFHDDVMDDAATRRGQPTTHALSAAEHAAAGWAGESRRFGDGVAILVGDLAFVYADQLMEAAPVEAVRLWNELRIELNIGQYLDIVGSVQRERRIEKAERICRYKSGKYTIERPLHLGALLADPSRAGELLPQLERVRPPARRRVPDARRRHGRVRRRRGHRQAGRRRPHRGQADTRCWRVSVARADAAQRAVLDLVGDPDLSAADVARIQQTIVDTGGLDELEAQITELATRAVAAIEAADITAVAKQELVALAEYVTVRTT